MAIRIIPAFRKQTASSPDHTTLRVAAYCRVSTDQEEQESSYEAQVSHYTDLINRTPSWVLAGIYSDEGISGTSTMKREGFLKMVKDCEKHKIDFVVTKSISRFARNTLDTLQCIRKLKDLGIPVYFEKENINTVTSSGELLLTILASLAQQESQSISLNVGMGIHYRFQAGKPMLNHTRFYGYTKQRGENLKIVEDEARIIRNIFRGYLEGMSIPEIIMQLEEDKVKTVTGKDTWSYTTIYSILTNEKFMGDLLLQKTYTVDFLTKKRKKNQGELPQYYIKDVHEPIIPREVFIHVQGLILQHRHMRKRSKQVLYGMVICGKCGSVYRRFTSKRYTAMWRCPSRYNEDSEKRCQGPSAYETQIQGAIIKAFNQLPEYKETLQRSLNENKESLGTKLLSDIAELDKQIERLENAADYASKGSSNEPGNDKNTENLTAAQEFRKEIEEIQFQRSELIKEKAKYGMKIAQIQSLLRLIDGMEGKPAPVSVKHGACTDIEDFYERTDRITINGPVIVFDEWMVRRFTSEVVVHDHSLEVIFKAGIKMEIMNKEL